MKNVAVNLIALLGSVQKFAVRPSKEHTMSKSSSSRLETWWDEGDSMLRCGWSSMG